MSLIKNSHMLSGIVSQEEINKMEHAALQHRQLANITFKVIEATEKKVVFQVVQGATAMGNYFAKPRLIEIVTETFGRFFKGAKLLAHATVYKEPVVNKVTHAWVTEKMKATGTKLQDIVNDTGINKTHLSSISTGDKPLSQQMKALLWYYFLSK